MSTILPAGGGNAGSVQEIIALRKQLIERSEALKGLRPPVPGADALQGTSATQGGAGSSFANTLTQALSSVNETQARSKEVGEAYQRGEVADVAQVMLAREEAGIAFEATLQVRNKLLTAYQDVMRMGL